MGATIDQGVAGKLQWLRDSAGAHSGAAADATWAWIEDLGNRSKADPARSDAELNELFNLGTVPADLDGPTNGIAVMFTMQALADPVLRTVIGLAKPWKGKKFDRANAEGINRMTKSMSVVSKAIWPLYTMKDNAGEKNAFEFKTFVEPSVENANVNVLVIDYKDVASNPSLIIRKIRDELVELVPGVYLGKIMYRLGSGNHTKLGYFALRTPR